MMVLESPMYNHIESRRFDRMMGEVVWSLELMESPVYNHMGSWKLAE